MSDISDLREQLANIANADYGDPEQDHRDAEVILLTMITRLTDKETGEQIARDFDAIEKWYA